MGSYPKVPYVVGEDVTLLHCERSVCKKVKIRRNLPGNIIVIHGVNDVGVSYKAVEHGLCEGMAQRLGRGFTPASCRMPVAADKDKLEDDPDAVFFKRTIDKHTNSPVIPFYWGYREVGEKCRTKNGQFIDRYGNRLDKDLSKEGGPFGNATSNLPDMWRPGIYAPVDPMGDALRPLRTAPGRMYMVLAAQRLAALIAMIRDYDADDTVSIVAHSQGCLLSQLAQAMLMEKGLAPADNLILTHPPYSLVDSLPLLMRGAAWFDGGEDAAMKPYYHLLSGAQTMGARLKTLVNIVAGVAKGSGNTGAATWFMQMAIGVMGSYRDGGASAAINLRDGNEASIIFITPPSDVKRQQQDANGDIFRSRITPAVDPANYAAPSVEAILESSVGK